MHSKFVILQLLLLFSMVNYTSNTLVCIPAFNEARQIAQIVNNAKKYCSEVLVCDDGSVDRTAEIAKNAGAIVIRHNSNRGYGAAIKTLFAESRKKNAEIIVTLDSDGQHDVNEIPKLINQLLREDVDIVIGSRFLNKKSQEQIPMYRSFGIRTITKLTQVASYENLTDSQSGFRAYSKNALEKINIYENGMSVSTEILLKAKEKDLIIKEVPITVRYDVEDASTQNPLKHGISVIHSVILFVSLKHPLTFYGILGLVFLGLGIAFMASALDLFSATRYVSTPNIILAAGFFIIGIVLLATSVILYTMAALLRGKLKES